MDAKEAVNVLAKSLFERLEHLDPLETYCATGLWEDATPDCRDIFRFAVTHMLEMNPELVEIALSSPDNVQVEGD